MNRVNSPVIWFNCSERYHILLLLLWHTCAVCLNCIKHFDRMNCESSPLQSHPTEMFKLKKQAVQNFRKINHAGTLGLPWGQPFWRRRSSNPAANLQHMFSPVVNDSPYGIGSILQAKRINNAQTAEVTFPPTLKPIPAGQTTAPKSINTHEFSATAQAHSR